MSEYSCENNVIQVSEGAFGASRRNFLKTVAVTAASLGMTGLASTAQAATKKYKVCATKDVKVGGASRFQINTSTGAIMVLITQPKAGTFRAFNAACTHMGSILGFLQGTNIVCPAHGASFDMNTGSVTRPPAQMPLTKYTITKTGTTLYINA